MKTEAYSRGVHVGNIAYVVGLGLMALVVVGVLVCANSASQRVRADEQLRDAFVAECIERHTAARCREFWSYGRTDLGRKP